MNMSEVAAALPEEPPVLVPGETYLLNWRTRTPVNNNKLFNQVVLTATFIKLFDNRHCEQFIQHKLNPEDVPPPQELADTILSNPSAYPFHHSLYPYITTLFNTNREPSCNFGLFKIKNIHKMLFKGGPADRKIPYDFLSLRSNTVSNAPTIGRRNLPNIKGEDTLTDDEEASLMWVDLKQVQIRPALDRLNALRRKAVDNMYNKHRLRTVPSEEIMSFFEKNELNSREWLAKYEDGHVGGKKYLSKRKKRSFKKTHKKRRYKK